MNYIVFGYKRHGKDTCAEHWEKEFGLTFAASSETACDLFIFEQMREEYGYKTKEECFEDRGNHRDYWYDAICEYNKDDRARLGKVIFSEKSVYCGIRDREEFEQMKSEGLFDMAIWIDAGERKPPEDLSSMNLNINDADIVIKNNGTEAEFKVELNKFYHRVIKPALDKEQGITTEVESALTV